MFEFRQEQITEHIKRIYGAGDACMYYIEGDTKGILVDTAYGVGDLKGYIDSITTKPYEVVVTHGHADHANGIAQFSEVYLNRKDRELYTIKTDIGLRRTMLKRTIPDIDTYPDSMFQPVFSGRFLDLEDGMVFNLGGVLAQVIAAPGHTQGMMVLLVREDRTILFGDACGVCTFLFKPESSTVKTYCETLKKLKTYEPSYDCVLRQHGTCESPKSILEDNLDVANDILNGTDDHIPFEYLGEHVWMAKEVDPATNSRKDGKSGNIVYSMEKIR